MVYAATKGGEQSNSSPSAKASTEATPNNAQSIFAEFTLGVRGSTSLIGLISSRASSLTPLII